MTQIKTSKGDFLMVPIPTEGKTIGDHADYFEAKAKEAGIDLNNTKWIGRSDTMTEEQAAMVVSEPFGPLKKYKSYDCGYPFEWMCTNAVDSFASLLRLRNLNAPNYACLKLLK